MSHIRDIRTMIWGPDCIAVVSYVQMSFFLIFSYFLTVSTLSLEKESLRPEKEIFRLRSMVRAMNILDVLYECILILDLQCSYNHDFLAR
jgi:hypothetical protein